MDDCLALADLATFSVDRDGDLLAQRIGQQRMQLLLAAAAALPGCPFRKRVCNGGPPCNRAGRPPYAAFFASAIRFRRLSQRVGIVIDCLLAHSGGVVNMSNC
jgi:hypothetical protein